MKRIIALAILGSLIVDGACGKGRPRPADTAINSDLALVVPQGARQPDRPADSSTRSFRVQPTPTKKTARKATGRKGLGKQASTKKATSHDSASDGEVAPTVAVIPAPIVVPDSANRKAKVKRGFDATTMGSVLGGAIGKDVDRKKTP